MTTAPTISVQGLSKRYRIGARQEQYQRFTEVLTNTLAAPLRRLARLRAAPPPEEVLWALRDVSFDIDQSNVVGIIGRNGAGKSTLLKLISRITEPSEGEIRLRGRVASLLEVGTGFHPELSGRENIFLNGAILGMRKAEILRKFDEIVAFAEVDRFIDTPVKRYSSGMHMRLAFAVAAHLEPEILLVDEVLAVGDAGFQRKCLGKMRDVSRGGRTVLFVSHNMGAIRNLCGSCLWIDGGRLNQRGPAEEIIGAYLRSLSDEDDGAVGERRFPDAPEKGFYLSRARLVDERGEPVSAFSCDEEIRLELTCRATRPIPGLYGYLSISRDDTVVLVSDSQDVSPNPLDAVEAGEHVLRLVIPRRTLGAGDYSVYVNFTSLMSEGGFQVDSPGVIGRFRLDDFGTARGNSRLGYFSLKLPWMIDG